MKKPKSEVLIYPQYAIASGIDMHKDIIISHVGSKTGQISETKEWTTMTEELYEIAKYLKSRGVEAVLMESTGIYWISLYHILIEAGLKVMVGNPLHIKQIPKRKTDKKDAQWLCTLVLNGLVRESFIPDSDQYEFREYCRIRDKYNRLITQGNNRIVRILEKCNIKLRSVASSIRTKTCEQIISAIIQGKIEEEELVQMCKGRLRKKMDQMRLAVKGRITQSDRAQLQMLKEDILHYREQLKKVEEKIKELQQKFYK